MTTVLWGKFMELIFAILSLIWVIGILSLQRIGSILNDFTRALAYYLSINDTSAIDKTQVELWSLMPRDAVLSLVRHIHNLPNRKDKHRLQESLRFFRISSIAVGVFEGILITSTLTIPIMYLIDFTSTHYLTIFNKNVVLYALFTLCVFTALLLPKLLSHISQRFNPLYDKK